MFRLDEVLRLVSIQQLSFNTCSCNINHKGLAETEINLFLAWRLANGWCYRSRWDNNVAIIHGVDDRVIYGLNTAMFVGHCY